MGFEDIMNFITASNPSSLQAVNEIVTDIATRQAIIFLNSFIIISPYELNADGNHKNRCHLLNKNIKFLINQE